MFRLERVNNHTLHLVENFRKVWSLKSTYYTPNIIPGGLSPKTLNFFNKLLVVNRSTDW